MPEEPQTVNLSQILVVQDDDAEGAGAETDHAEVVGAEVVGAEVAEAAEADIPFTYQPAKPGRPTKEHVAALGLCRTQVLNLIKELADEHKVSPARVLDEVTSAFSGASSRVRNPWNLYSKMATHPDWCETEVRRLIPTFNRTIHEMPTLRSEHLSFMYQQFVQEHAEGDAYLKILQDFETTEVLESETTIAQRQRRVVKAAKKIEHLVNS
jgi:hypothetical protein